MFFSRYFEANIILIFYQQAIFAYKNLYFVKWYIISFIYPGAKSFGKSQ